LLFCASDGFHGAGIFALDNAVFCIDAEGYALIASTSKPAGHMVSDNDIVGYTIGYDQEDIHFPVYAMTAFAVALIAAGIVKGVPILAIVGLLPAAVAFYHLPLIERDKPRIGSGEYGLFIEGLGLISWRAVDSIETLELIERGGTVHDLVINLKQPIPDALLADWRSRPLLRRAMRLPWHLESKTEIRIPLDVLDKPAGEIKDNFVRMWRFNRGA